MQVQAGLNTNQWLPEGNKIGKGTRVTTDGNYFFQADECVLELHSGNGSTPF